MKKKKVKKKTFEDETKKKALKRSEVGGEPKYWELNTLVKFEVARKYILQSSTAGFNVSTRCNYQISSLWFFLWCGYLQSHIENCKICWSNTNELRNYFSDAFFYFSVARSHTSLPVREIWDDLGNHAGSVEARSSAKLKINTLVKFDKKVKIKILRAKILNIELKSKIENF